MEKAFNSYETMFITDVSIGEDATKATIEKFTTLIGNNAEVVGISNWGKKRLAYPINDMNEGAYTVVTYKADPSFIAELERLFNIDETIMRSLTIKCEHELVAAKVEEAEAVEETAEVVEETVVAEEPAEDAE